MRALAILLAVSTAACSFQAPPPEPLSPAQQRAKDAETRAEHQRQREEATAKRREEDNAAAAARDAQVKADYEARREQQRNEAAKTQAANEAGYQAAEERRKQIREDARAERLQREAEEKAEQDAELAKCKASPSCVWQPVAEPLCKAIQEKRGFQQDIARENKNPSGFINITYLHGLGREIQDRDELIAHYRAEYRTAMGRPLNESVCQK